LLWVIWQAPLEQHAGVAHSQPSLVIVAKLQSARPVEHANAAPGRCEGDAVEGAGVFKAGGRLGAVVSGRCVGTREVGRADGAAVCFTLGAVVCASVGDGGGSGALVDARAYAEIQAPKSLGESAPHDVAGLPEHRPWQQSAHVVSAASTGAKASLNTGTHNEALTRSK